MQQQTLHQTLLAYPYAWITAQVLRFVLKHIYNAICLTFPAGHVSQRRVFAVVLTARYEPAAHGAAVMQ
jgi:hypothetical protein